MLKNTSALLFILLLLVSCAENTKNETGTTTPEVDYTAYVDLFIGTGGHGHTFLGCHAAVWDGVGKSHKRHQRLGLGFRLSLFR